MTSSTVAAFPSAKHMAASCSIAPSAMTSGAPDRLSSPPDELPSVAARLPPPPDRLPSVSDALSSPPDGLPGVQDGLSSVPDALSSMPSAASAPRAHLPGRATTTCATHSPSTTCRNPIPSPNPACLFSHSGKFPADPRKIPPPGQPAPHHSSFFILPSSFP